MGYLDIPQPHREEVFQSRRRRYRIAWAALYCQRPELAEAFYVNDITLEQLEAELGLPCGSTLEEEAARYAP